MTTTFRRPAPLRAATFRPTPVSTRQFHYDPATQCFSAEISSTHGLGRVWDDSADQGFTMVSTRTSAEVVFVLTEEIRDEEGDTRWWTFRSIDGRFTADLFND